MKINSYCIDCGKPILYYNRAIRCKECYFKYRKIGAKWLIKYCIDCRLQLKSKNPKTKRCKKCAGVIHSKRMKNKKLSCKRRKQLSKFFTEKWKDKNFKKTRINNLLRGKNHPNFKHGKSSKKHYCIDCNKEISWRAKRCKSCANKISSIKRWQNKKYKEKTLKSMLKSSFVKPNKKEKLLNKLLNRLLPNEYKLNVKGNIIILANKVPDFVNINGQKKIIELFGDYWHSDKFIKKHGKYEDTEKGRIKYFKKYGYKTLIIWEKELKDLKIIKNKILEFHNDKT